MALFTRDSDSREIAITNNILISYCFTKLRDPFITILKYQWDDELLKDIIDKAKSVSQ